MFWPVAIPVAGIVYLLTETQDRSIKEEIEGVGLFNFAKLSGAEIEKAKAEAEEISQQIIERMKQKANAKP